MPSPQPAHGDDNFTWALTTSSSSSSSSSRSNPQYCQHAGNKRQPNIPNKLETKKTPRTTIKTHTDVWSQLPTDYTDLPLQAGTNSAQWSLALSCSRGTTGRRTSSLCLDKNGTSQVDQGEQKKCFCHNPRKKSGLKCSNLFLVIQPFAEFRNLVAAWYLVANIYLIHWKYFSLPFREVDAKPHSGTAIGFPYTQGEKKNFFTDSRTNKIIFYFLVFKSQ